MFPAARILLAEVQDLDWGVSFPGPVQRAVDAGADGYVVAQDLGALAEFRASDARLALSPGRPGQLGAASSRTPSPDEAVLRELTAADDIRGALD